MSQELSELASSAERYIVHLQHFVDVHDNFYLSQDSGSYGDIGIFVKTLAEGGAAHRVGSYPRY